MADDLALGMSDLTALLLTGAEVDDSLCAVAEIVTRMLPGHPMTGMTLTYEQGDKVGGSSDAHAMLVKEAECSDGYDPSLQAIVTAQEISVPDVAQEQRWDGYRARMLGNGVHSIYSLPISVDGAVVGAMTLYSPKPRNFTARVRRAASLTAEHLGVLFGVATETTRQSKLTEQLRETLASRSTIDQALGILMAELRCDRDAAFAVLRSKSQRQNVRVADLAVEMIERVTGGAPSPPHFAEPQEPKRSRRRA
ncbi:GAF domain-containing protein [Nocardia tenerifensis]|uniref:GAF domain-containing protein n=1 Tax=Nocardia tenerifensis TaxID=228006 RepID=A0A318K0V8_9NOCA|nr:GAF and ANTAR domain-containing protein [Nocardia tenerifensis]PXX60425.1 GAF domain-containing protein [Nocardia tenerifensis]